MNIVILGMPGAGKGTIASFLEEAFGWKHVSTGDMLRAEVERSSEIGKRVQEILSSGALVNDELMGELVKGFTQSLNGFILDGYPRTLAQCKLLKSIVHLDKVIYLKVTEEVVTERLMERSKTAETKRSDDKREVIVNRLEVFKKNNQAILDFYRSENILFELDASGSVETVRSAIKEHFK